MFAYAFHIEIFHNYICSPEQVEVFAQHGRAQIAAHEWGASGDTAVHMAARGSGGAVVSYDIFAMGCGWEGAGSRVAANDH